jgi:hypothetical protein
MAAGDNLRIFGSTLVFFAAISLACVASFTQFDDDIYPQAYPIFFVVFAGAVNSIFARCRNKGIVETGNYRDTRYANAGYATVSFIVTILYLMPITFARAYIMSTIATILCTLAVTLMLFQCMWYDYNVERI